VVNGKILFLAAGTALIETKGLPGKKTALPKGGQAASQVSKDQLNSFNSTPEI
jgi:hypothetical protein